jgi:two-component system chemotaxis response regulator CheY
MFPPKTRILVVDDMGPLRAIVKGQLKDLGFTDILEASDGHRAIEVLKTEFLKGQPVELILSDWNMPVMKGIEFLKLVRADKRLGPLPFIMITAESERTLVMDAVKAGVSSYIMKPFTPAMLEAKMKTVWTKLHP